MAFTDFFRAAKTVSAPDLLSEDLRIMSTDLKKMLASRKIGDISKDMEILKLMFDVDDKMQEIFFSFLQLLKHEGSLNQNNIPVLKQICEIDNAMEEHAEEGLKEVDYLRRLSAHLEASVEERLSKLEKLQKHLELAAKYMKLAKEHEEIARKNKKP